MNHNNEGNSVVDADILNVEGAAPVYTSPEQDDERHPNGMLKSIPYTVEEQEYLDNPTEVELQRTHAHTHISDKALNVEMAQPGSFAEQAAELVHEHATPGHNAPPPSREELIKEFNKDIAKLGKDSGLGSAALPRLGLRVVRAAADGLISTEKPKAGEKSDAVRIYEAYAANDSKHAEHTSGGMKANAAKVNALIGLGCMTTCDGVTVADRAVRIRERMEGAELKPKPLFAGLVDVARAQLASDQELTDAAIETALTKTKADKTLEKEWEAIQKKVDALVTGEGSHGLKDQSDEALKIAELIAEKVSCFKSDNSDIEIVEGLMERGHSRVAAEETVRPGAKSGWSM